MSKTVTLTWDIIANRQSGGPLLLSDVSRVEVEMSADGGANWAGLTQLSPTDPQTVTVPDLEFGSWQFRFTVVDTDERRSDPQIEVVEVVDDSPPAGIGNVVVTVG